MSLVKPYINNLKRIERDLSKIAKDVVVNNKQTIINLLKYGQLEQGIDAFGKVVGKYALTTQGYANAQNISTPKTFQQPYNFKWSGQTIDNLKISKIVDDSYDITTVASKKRLFQELGWDILRLTKEHNDWINETIIKPKLYEYILKNMFRVN